MRSRCVPAAAVLFLFSVAGCRCGSPFVQGDSECNDDHCICVGTPTEEICAADCGGGGCSTECRNAVECQLDCGNRCNHLCSDMNVCDMACGDDCQLACMHMQSCASDCGARCDQICEDASSCAFSVGADSQVACRRVGACDVTCLGNCRVSCEDVGSCRVICADGSAAPVCPGGVTRVCNESC